MEHHFVVIYNDTTKTWKIDDTEQTWWSFPTGEIYSDDDQWFVANGNNTPPEVSATYAQASGDLAAVLAIAQFARGKK